MTLLTHWEGEPLAVWQALWRVPSFEAHDRLGSTNDRLRELLAAGAGVGSVVIATEQTAGRGRSGRSWLSPAGCGLWMSTSLPCGATIRPHVSLAVGVAVARALEEVSGVDACVEWPNDVVVGARKLAGILCEGAAAAVVVGVGVNLRAPPGGFPPELAGRAAALEDAAARRVAPSRLAGALLRELARLRQVPERGLDPELLEELARRDALAGRRVRSDLAGEGIARGIDVDGALRLQVADGPVTRVVAGSVRPL